MLAHLHISNFLLVDEVQLAFQPGFTAITGETGAGKSMILGALRVLFGDTLSEQMIRNDAERTVIEADFKLASSEILQLLSEEYRENVTDVLSVRRELTRGGRARGFLQDRPATIELLKSIGEQLMDFHGQRDSLSLFRPSRQLEFLDAFTGAAPQREKVATAYRQRVECLQKRDQLLQEVQERRKEQALLAYQLEEIERLGLREGEDVDIAKKLKKLEQSEKLITLANQIAGVLEQNDICAVTLTGQARQFADEIKRFDDSFSIIATELADITARLRDISAEVCRYAEHDDVNPLELENMRQRAATLSELRRKHGVDLGQIIEQGKRMKNALETLTALEKEMAKCDQELKIANQSLSDSAKLLSKARSAASAKFSAAITDVLEPLGFTKPRFGLKIETSDFENIESISRSGADQVQFLFSASAGQTLQPLSEVASGGESSRVTLAIKSVVAERMHYPLLVYDEIDLGISGRVAASVASVLHDLGRAQQLIVVTHLPQIAARAEHHLQVFKSAAGKRTITSAAMLLPEQRAEAVAELLAGAEISDSALAAAGELLNSQNSQTE